MSYFCFLIQNSLANIKDVPEDHMPMEKDADEMIKAISTVKENISSVQKLQKVRDFKQ